jgi:hypothetical protein
VLTTFKCYEAAFGLATRLLHESGDYGEPATHGNGNKLCALHRPAKV